MNRRKRINTLKKMQNKIKQEVSKQHHKKGSLIQKKIIENRENNSRSMLKHNKLTSGS